MVKPVAYYEEELSEVRPGRSCCVLNVDHPELGFEKIIITSQVIEVMEDGFETLNTIYRQKKPSF